MLMPRIFIDDRILEKCKVSIEHTKSNDIEYIFFDFGEDLIRIIFKPNLMSDGFYVYPVATHTYTVSITVHDKSKKLHPDMIYYGSISTDSSTFIFNPELITYISLVSEAFSADEKFDIEMSTVSKGYIEYTFIGDIMFKKESDNND